MLFGRGPHGFQGWSKAKQRLDTRIAQAGQPLPEWDLHDVRRSVETRLSGLRVRKELVNRILNHAVGPITETYDHYDYLREKRAALRRWADALERILSKADPT